MSVNTDPNTITLDHKGQLLSLYDFGGAGRPILFTHAASFCAKMWEPTITKLNLDKYRVFSLDMRGHGRSQTDATSFDWHEASRDVEFVAKEILKLTESEAPLIGVGHSMGGTCLMMAEIQSPGLFEKIWAFEPIMFNEGNEERREITQSLADGARRRKDYFPNLTSASERFASKPPMQFFDADCLAAFIQDGLIETESGQQRLACLPNFEATVYENAGTGVTARMDDLQSPVEFVVGDVDSDRVPAILGLIDSGAESRHRVTNLSGANHFTPFIKPDDISQSINDWL